MELLQSLYREALQEPATCFVFCAGNQRSFMHGLQTLLPALAEEYCLALLPESLNLSVENRNLRVVCDAEMPGADFLRSAFRQDPDGVIVDARGRESLPILVQAKLTGHRVFFHHPLTAAEALSDCFATLSQEGEYLASEFLNRSLFIGLSEDGPETVWQVRSNGDAGLFLAALLEKTDDDWCVKEPLQLRSRVQPTPLEPEVLQVPPEWPESGEQFLEDLRNYCEPHARTTWAPVLGRPGQPGDYGCFGGTPNLEVGEECPRCGCCGAHMTPVVQICLSRAPESFRSKVGQDGLFQFFYCVSDDCNVKAAWEPFQKNSLARRITGDTSTPDTSTGAYEEIPIVGWTALNEGPGWEERFSLQIPRDFLAGDLFTTFAEMAGTWMESGGYYEQLFSYFGLSNDGPPEIFELVRTLPGDKLLGWPCWSQGVEYPLCPSCTRPMEMLMQINNDGFGSGAPGCGSALGQVFAADGNGHIWRCPEHGEMTFSWACG